MFSNPRDCSCLPPTGSASQVDPDRTTTFSNSPFPQVHESVFPRRDEQGYFTLRGRDVPLVRIAPVRVDITSLPILYACSNVITVSTGVQAVSVLCKPESQRTGGFARFQCPGDSRSLTSLPSHPPVSCGVFRWPNRTENLKSWKSIDSGAGGRWSAEVGEDWT